MIYNYYSLSSGYSLPIFENLPLAEKNLISRVLSDRVFLPYWAASFGMGGNLERTAHFAVFATASVMLPLAI